VSSEGSFFDCSIDSKSYYVEDPKLVAFGQKAEFSLAWSWRGGRSRKCYIKLSRFSRRITRSLVVTFACTPIIHLVER